MKVSVFFSLLDLVTLQKEPSDREPVPLHLWILLVSSPAENHGSRVTDYSIVFYQENVFINSFPASGDFCHLLIIFANSLDPDQARKDHARSGSKLFDTLKGFLKDFFEKL